MKITDIILHVHCTMYMCDVCALLIWHFSLKSKFRQNVYLATVLLSLIFSISSGCSTAGAAGMALCAGMVVTVRWMSRISIASEWRCPLPGILSPSPFSGDRTVLHPSAGLFSGDRSVLHRTVVPRRISGLVHRLIPIALSTTVNWRW